MVVSRHDGQTVKTASARETLHQPSFNVPMADKFPVNRNASATNFTGRRPIGTVDGMQRLDPDNGDQVVPDNSDLGLFHASARDLLSKTQGMPAGHHITLISSILQPNAIVLCRNTDGGILIRTAQSRIQNLAGGLEVRADGTCYYNGTLVRGTERALPRLKTIVRAATEHVDRFGLN
jgi:hypothetical protein